MNINLAFDLLASRLFILNSLNNLIIQNQLLTFLVMSKHHTELILWHPFKFLRKWYKNLHAYANKHMGTIFAKNAIWGNYEMIIRLFDETYNRNTSKNHNIKSLKIGMLLPIMVRMYTCVYISECCFWASRERTSIGT